MAPLPDIPQTMRCDFTWGDGVSTFGSRIFIIYGADTPSHDDLDTAASTIKGLWVDDLAPATSAGYNLVAVKLTDLSASTGATGEWTGSEPGLLSGLAVPSNVSQDLDIYIDSRYRGGHPLMHHPGARAGDVGTLRKWTDDQITLMSGAASDFLGDINGSTFVGTNPALWVVLRGYRPGATTGDVTSFAVSDIRLRPYLGTMRRRVRALR